MAIARLSVGVGKKGKASPHAQYIAREGKYAKPSTHAEKLENTGHGNMPKWAEHDPNYFWKMADEHERKNGSTYREHVIALPRELDENQRHELVKDWIKNEIGDKHAYQYAIHNPPAMDGGEQPHAHIMFSERLIDDIERDPDQYFKRHNSKNPDKGGAKKANTPKKSSDRKAELVAMRDRWEKTCNAHLERAGKTARISMKSHKDRGLKYKPINLTMQQLKDPKIKETYKTFVNSKEDYLSLRRQTAKEIKPKAELAQQERQQAQAEKQAQEQARQQAIVQAKAEQAQEQAKAQAQAKAKAQAEAQTKAEQARPKTIKELVESWSNEQRQQAKQMTNQTISQYHKDINDKAIELYENATPPNQRAKPLFAHYAYSDLKEVQPYKALAQQEIDEKDPSRYKDYASAIEVTNAIQEVERSEGYQQQTERIREQQQDKDQDRGR